MPEKLVTLRAADAGVAAIGAAAISIRLRAYAPQGQCRLRLWDANGRNPVNVGNDWYFYRETAQTRPLEISDPQPRPLTPAELRNRTLTWSVRMARSAPDADDRFAIFLQVLQDGQVLPNGDFSYSGPLDDFEEQTGRFHFKVE